MSALTSTEAALLLYCAEGNLIDLTIPDELVVLLVFAVYVVLKTAPKLLL